MYMIENEYENIRRIQQGQTECYKLLVLRYQSVIFNLLYTMLRQPVVAEDLTQEVFIRAYENIGKFNYKSRFFCWIYRIAINTAITYKKKNNRIIFNETSTPDTEESIEDRIVGIERNMLLNKAIERMNDKYKQVLMLKYFEQLTYTEIAEVLNIHEKKVKSRLFDARKSLRSYLDKNGYF
jgi:RNA polymerase sigma-70 factor, ECF subfamily